MPDDYGAEVDQPLYLAAAMTGLRQGELLALRWGDVDLLATRVRVAESFTRGVFDHQSPMAGAASHDENLRSLRTYPSRSKVDLVVGELFGQDPLPCLRPRSKFIAKSGFPPEVSSRDVVYARTLRRRAPVAPARAVVEDRCPCERAVIAPPYDSAMSNVPFDPAPRPAEMLTGLVLEGGWSVVSRVPSFPGGTGGSFSTPYIVERNGARAFLKAIDFTRALTAPDPARALEALTRIFNFERDLMETCTRRRMRNVVRVVNDGTITIVGGGPVPQVNYLIFELADGDIRRVMQLSADLDAAWAFRTLQHVALGLAQLHSAGIAHQDLKPSNVLRVEGTFKLGDLGRASVRGEPGLYDHLRFAGDPNYLTPEQMYGFDLPDWDSRRRAVDLYHLGSLLLFLLTGVSATAACFTHLDPAHLPAPWGQWGGTFDEVLVHLREASGRVTDLIPVFSDSELRDRAVTRFVELCDPDPRRRGHPKNRLGIASPYSLERYVSHFDALAARAQRCVVSVTRG